MSLVKNLQSFFCVFLTIMVFLCVSSCVIKLKPPKSEVLSFSGYEWIVKSSEIPINPGPNYFSDSKKNVWVDKKGQLHLRITKKDGKWHCAKVISKKSFGYGKYIFYLASGIDELDENVVAGLFTWDKAPEYNHREIDIEFSKWGGLHSENALFVAQGKNARHRHRFDIQLNGNYSTHSFIWRSQDIFFQSIHGHYPSPPSNNHIIKLWTYVGEDIPPPGNETVRINLWLFKGNPPLNNKRAEIIIKKFEFIPQTEIN